MTLQFGGTDSSLRNSFLHGDTFFSCDFDIHTHTSIHTNAMASFETLQERLTALQESTLQLRELINRLANIKFQPGSLPAGISNSVASIRSSGGDDETTNVATDLSAEISQMLREDEEELELLREEVTDLRSGRPGSETEHRRTRLKEGVQRLQAEFKGFVSLHLA